MDRREERQTADMIQVIVGEQQMGAILLSGVYWEDITCIGHASPCIDNDSLGSIVQYLNATGISATGSLAMAAMRN
jgi:hypothetical protein